MNTSIFISGVVLEAAALVADRIILPELIGVAGLACVKILAFETADNAAWLTHIVLIREVTTLALTLSAY